LNRLTQKTFLFLLVALALASGLLWSQRNWEKEPTGDGYHYNKYALSLVNEGRFAADGELTQRRDPGYSFFLAAVYSIWGVNYTIVKLLQIVMFAAIVLTTYFLARQLFDNESIARWSGIFSGLFYPLAMFGGIFYTELLFTLVFLLAIWFFIKGWKVENKYYYAVSGLFFGMAILTRSVIVYFPVLLLIAYPLLQKESRKKALVASFLFLFCTALVVTPWMTRNQRNFGDFAVSAQEGSILFFAVQRLKIQNSDLTKVFTANILGDFFAQKIFGSYDRQKIEEGDFGQVHTELAEQGLNQDEINTKVYQLAVGEFKSKTLRYFLVVPPIEFLKLHTPIFPFETAQGLFSDPGTHQEIPDFVKGAIILFVRLAYLLFLSGVLYGIIRSGKLWRQHLIILLLLFYIIGVYSVLHGIPRYILPIFPLYIIFFSYGVLVLRKKSNEQTL